MSLCTSLALQHEMRSGLGAKPSSWGYTTMSANRRWVSDQNTPCCTRPLASAGHWLDNFGAISLRHKPAPIFSPSLCKQLLSYLLIASCKIFDEACFIHPHTLVRASLLPSGTWSSRDSCRLVRHHDLPHIFNRVHPSALITVTSGGKMNVFIWKKKYSWESMTTQLTPGEITLSGTVSWVWR